MEEGTSGTLSVTNSGHQLTIAPYIFRLPTPQHTGTPMLTMNSSFGHWLKQQRRSLDLTQDELAERIGCSSDLIRKVEAGTRRPSRYIAEQLAHSLEIVPEKREVFVR